MSFLKKAAIYSLVSLISFNLLITGVKADSFSDAQSKAGATAALAGVQSGSPEAYVYRIVYWALSLIGIIFLLLMIYGGYIWMIARGNESEAKKAKGIITMGVIGMVVVLLAYALSAFILTRLVVSVSGTS